MVLDATYPDGRLFHALVGAMENVIEQCLFTISPAGIRISRLDKNQVVMVDLWLPKESFLRYNLRSNHPEQEVGVSITDLKKILSWMTNDPIHIHALNRKVKFSQKRTGMYEERSIQMPTIDVDRSGEAQPPDQRYPSRATFSNSLFGSLLRTHLDNHDTVALTITKSSFIIELCGHEQFNGITTLHRTTADPNKMDTLSIQTRKRSVRQLLPTSQFRKFGAASELCRTVDINMIGDEEAVKVAFNVGEDGEGYLAFYIAPKIESGN